MPRAVRVEGVPHPISHQVDAKDGKDDEKAGEDPHPPGASLDKGLGAGEHVTPRGGRRLDAQAEEGYVGLAQDGARKAQGG